MLKFDFQLGFCLVLQCKGSKYEVYFYDIAFTCGVSPPKHSGPSSIIIIIFYTVRPLKQVVKFFICYLDYFLELAENNNVNYFSFLNFEMPVRNSIICKSSEEHK